MDGFAFDPDGAPTCTANLPNGCCKQVVDAALSVGSQVATKGVGEKLAAKGFLILLGDSGRLLTSGMIGNPVPTKYNKYEGKTVCIQDVASDDEAKRFVYPDFIIDGAMIIDWATGKILGSGYTVTENMKNGSTKGGKKHTAASAASQSGPCVAIKCSEDSCGIDGEARGDFCVFLGTVEGVKVPVRSKNLVGDDDPPKATVLVLVLFIISLFIVL